MIPVDTNNYATPTGPRLHEDYRPMSAEDRVLMQHLEPIFEQTMREIMQEIQVERGLGLVRPFVEGEPIGKYEPRPPRRPARPIY